MTNERAERLRLEKENAELKARLSEWERLKTDSQATHLNILRGTVALTREAALHLACAQDYDELKQQLAAFHAAMEREKKPDWQKWLKDLADSLETEWDPGKSSCAEAARQLRYMADSFTLKANFVPSELKIKELEQQLETANLCIRGLEGNLAAFRSQPFRW